MFEEISPKCSEVFFPSNYWYIKKKLVGLLGDFTLGFHAAVALNKILLTSKDGQRHEQLTYDSRHCRHSNGWVHIETVNKN